MDTEFVSRLLADGLSPAAYQTVMEQQAALDPALLEGVEAERAEFAKLNLHRAGRLKRTWRPSPKLTQQVARIEQPQVWMILTEPWCGDSAQCMPCLEVLAEDVPAVTIRYLLRDSNLEIMDQYLTDGKRSIPIVVAFDKSGKELFRWGSRPAAAQAVFDLAAAEGLDKPAKLEKLHLFYGRDRGAAFDAEMVAVLV